MPKYKVGFARFPGCSLGGNIENDDVVDWIIKTVVEMSADDRIEVLRCKKKDTPATLIRNAAVAELMDQGADYILMIDNDTVPDYEIGDDHTAKPFWETSWAWTLRMREEGKWGAVAAPYVGPPPHENIYAFHWTSLESHRPEDFPFKLDQFSREEAAQRTGIEEIGALATGCILYDMRVFHTMPRPWFYYQYEGDGLPCKECGEPKPGTQAQKSSTEDVTQTRDMSMVWHSSAGGAGGICWVNWDAWAAHMKLKACRKPKLLYPDVIGPIYRAAMKRHTRTDARVMKQPLVLAPEVLEQLKARNGQVVENVDAPTG